VDTTTGQVWHENRYYFEVSSSDGAHVLRSARYFDWATAVECVALQQPHVGGCLEPVATHGPCD
jgi:hypothetical protein